MPEAYFGLPNEVLFCRRCVISNQRPNSAVELRAHQGRARRRRSTSTRTACAMPAASPSRSTAASTGPSASARCASCCDRTAATDGSYDCLVPGSRRQGQLLRRARAQVQVRHAPAHGDLGAAHLHRMGLAELPELDPRRLRQLPLHAQRPGAPPADAAGGREPVPPVPAVHLRPEGARAEDGAAAQDPAGVLRRERGRVRQPDRRHAVRQARLVATSLADDKSKIYLGGTSVADLQEHFGVDAHDLQPYLPADPEEIEQQKVEVHYLGYYLKWHPQSCYYYAVEHGGFQASPERTPGTYSKYNSIDDRIDDFHYYTTLHQVRHRPRHLRRRAGDPLAATSRAKKAWRWCGASTASSRSALPKRSSAT